MRLWGLCSLLLGVAALSSAWPASAQQSERRERGPTVSVGAGAFVPMRDLDAGTSACDSRARISAGPLVRLAVEHALGGRLALRALGELPVAAHFDRRIPDGCPTGSSERHSATLYALYAELLVPRKLDTVRELFFVAGGGMRHYRLESFLIPCPPESPAGCTAADRVEAELAARAAVGLRRVARRSLALEIGVAGSRSEELNSQADLSVTLSYGW